MVKDLSYIVDKFFNPLASFSRYFTEVIQIMFLHKCSSFLFTYLAFVFMFGVIINVCFIAY